jgi:hypothetical protein
MDTKQYYQLSNEELEESIFVRKRPDERPVSPSAFLNPFYKSREVEMAPLHPEYPENSQAKLPYSAEPRHPEYRRKRYRSLSEQTPYLPFLSEPFQISLKGRDEIGAGVLGRTWIGTDRIELLDSLDSDEMYEVFVHERMHQRKPWLSEQEIRMETAAFLLSQGTTPRFHELRYA